MGAAGVEQAVAGTVPWTWRDVGIGYVWFLGVFFIPQIVAGVPLLLALGRDSAAAWSALAVVSMLTAAGFVYVAHRFTLEKYHLAWGALGFRKPTWGTLGWAAVALVGAFAVNLAWQGFVHGLDLDGLKQGCADQIPSEIRENRLPLALIALAVVVFAPLSEEIYFRGFTLQGLVQPIGVAAAIIVSGSVFGLTHLIGNPILYKSVVPLCAVGIVFGFVFWKSGNLLATMSAHFTFNLIGIIGIAATVCNE